MAHIPENHPRAHSLRLRERLANGFKAGIVTETGMIAHGRGEALDYLLSERTHDFALEAISAAAAAMSLAVRPVVSINGNVAALAAEELTAMQRAHPQLIFEVNIFHYSAERASAIVDHLHDSGMTGVLESTQANPVQLEGLDSARKHMHPEGLAQADVVLVGLEDGDRCEALVASGRTVIAIDLNPLSRTARMAQIPIVDELTRTLPRLTEELILAQSNPTTALKKTLNDFQPREILQRAVRALREGSIRLEL